MRAASAAVLVMSGALAALSACSTSDGRSTANGSVDAGAAGNGNPSSGGSSSGGSSSGGAPSGSGGGGLTGGAGNAATGGKGASSADAGGDGSAGKPADPCATARFCETFESYTAGTPPGGDWQAQLNHGAVSVVTEQRYGGSKAARFSTEANTGSKTAFIRLASASVFPVPGNAYFGRMMFWLESSPDQSVHWTFIQSGGMVAGQGYHALYRYGGQHPVTQAGSFVGNQLMANYDTPDSYSGTGPSSDCWHHANGTVVPVGRWACVEWQFDGPNDTLRLWLDGAAQGDLTVQGKGQGCVNQPATFEWTAPTFEHVELGWESYQGDSARTLYVDDVVIATARIGCPASP